MDQKNHRNNPNKYYNFTLNGVNGSSRHASSSTDPVSRLSVNSTEWIPECAPPVSGYTQIMHHVFSKNQSQDPPHSTNTLNIVQNIQVDAQFVQNESLVQIEDISMNWKEYVLKDAILSFTERDSQKYDETYYDMIEPQQKFWKSLGQQFMQTVNESESLKFEMNKYFYSPSSSIHNMRIMRVKELCSTQLRDDAKIVRLLVNFDFKNAVYSCDTVKLLYKKLHPNGHYAEVVFGTSCHKSTSATLLYIGAPVFEGLKNADGVISSIVQSLQSLGPNTPVQAAPKDYEESFMYKNNLILDNGHLEREAAEANLLTVQKLNQQQQSNSILDSVAVTFTNVLFSNKSSLAPVPAKYQLCVHEDANKMGSVLSPIWSSVCANVYKLPSLFTTIKLKKNTILNQLKINANMNLPLSMKIIASDGKIIVSKMWGTTNTLLHFNRQWIDDLCHSEINDSCIMLQLHDVEPLNSVVYGSLILTQPL